MKSISQIFSYRLCSFNVVSLKSLLLFDVIKMCFYILLQKFSFSTFSPLTYADYIF